VLAGSVASTAPAPAASTSAAPVNEDKVCRSPVSGVVVRLIAQSGQHLQVGDPLMVLEAMKMETNISAPIAGRIKALKIAQGDNVQSGQVVVEFE
jgi:methylmalonyl-CoA carboxyltransferase small subunit